MAERVCGDFVGRHALVPSVGKTAHAFHTARRFEDGLDLVIMTSVLRLGKGACRRTEAVLGYKTVAESDDIRPTFWPMAGETVGCPRTLTEEGFGYRVE